MKFAKLSSVNDHGLDLPVFVKPEEVIMIAEGRYGPERATVCTVIMRHGANAMVYGDSEEVQTALLEAQRVM